MKKITAAFLTLTLTTLAFFSCAEYAKPDETLTSADDFSAISDGDSAQSTEDDDTVTEAEELEFTPDLALIDFPVTLGMDGYWELNLGPDLVKNIAAVHNYMLWDSGWGTRVMFGVKNEIISDWNNGVFSERYSGMWGCIDDVQVYMQAVSVGTDYAVYSSPVMLNGIEHSLFIEMKYESYHTREYAILGVQKDKDAAKHKKIKEPDTADMTPLKPGDILEPLHFLSVQQDDGTWKKENFVVKSLVINDNPKFYEKSLGDGHFRIMFSMVDHAGNEYLSQPGDFKVKDGVIERVEGWTEYQQPANTVQGLYIDKKSDSFNPDANSPYYTATLDMKFYIDNATALGLPRPNEGDQMSAVDGGGGYVIEIFTRDPSINLDDFVAERLVYMQGGFIDSRQTHQRDMAFEITGIMAADGGADSALISGILREYDERPEHEDESLYISNGYYEGTLYRSQWYHDGREEMLETLYVVLDIEQYAELTNALGGIEDVCGQGDRTEIQIYATEQSLSDLLNTCIGKKIRFQAEDFFVAETAYHQRNIVMAVKAVEAIGIFGSSGSLLSDSEKYVLDLAQSVATLLKNEDWRALGALVHPMQGVTFSPYAFVDTSNAVKLGIGDVKALGMDDTVRTWGNYDGSGEPIICTFAEYYDRFIMSHDFSQAPQIGVNTLIKTGNTESNLYVFGNGGAYIEFHFPQTPFDEDALSSFAGHDWASLRLVFAEYENELYLVGIVHDEWTI